MLLAQATNTPLKLKHHLSLLLIAMITSQGASAVTNLVGNGVATIVISRWEKEISRETLNENLRNPFPLSDAV